MLFNVETDGGTSITGYLVPDTFAVNPSIRVRDQGAELLTFEANETRHALVEAGRHATGQCGFRIDEAMVPGLGGLSGLSLHDADSDLLIYRRSNGGAVIPQKVFRLETHLVPLWRLDAVFEDKFQFFYPRADHYGRETATQLFLLTGGDSCLISGRLLYKNYEMYVVDKFKCFAILRDPYDELAERMLFLSQMGSNLHHLLGERDRMIFEPVITALNDTTHLEETSMRRFFKRLSSDVIAILSNPLVRQLTAQTPDAMPPPGCLASALDILSSFEGLGLRSDDAHSRGIIAEGLGLDEAALPSLAEFPRVSELGRQLKEIRTIEGFLEKDLDLFHHMTQAFQKVAP